VASGAIFFYCAALVGFVRYALGRGMNVERDGPAGWRAFTDGAFVLRTRRLNLWLGVGALVVAVALTVGWALGG